MKNWIKENIVLALGISLPLMLVVFFMLAGSLPRFFVAAPVYDCLFSFERYGSAEFRVLHGTLYVQPEGTDPKAEPPHLFRYVAATGKTEEISFDMPEASGLAAEPAGNPANVVVSVDPGKLPTDEQARQTAHVVSEIRGGKHLAPVLLKETAGLHLIASVQAPDGYRFVEGATSYSGGLLYPGEGYHERAPAIEKSGRVIALPLTYPGNSAYGPVRFLGWVTP